MSPQVGQAGQFVNSNGSVSAALISSVDSATQVDVLEVKSSITPRTNVPYVEVGGAVPAGVGYFQEIAVA